MPGGQVHVGCSGWQYRHWRGDFYPAELPQTRWFAHYALFFDTVEINNSFYRLPEATTFAKWRQQAPRHFVYAVKASRFLTHMKKLKDPEEPVGRLFSRAVELRGKLGPVLYQLPKQMPKNVERLAAFLDLLPERVRHVIEFREPSWYDEQVMRLLRQHNVALCLHDMPGSETPRVLTARFAYVRFHGATGRYNGAYSTDALLRWAEWLLATAVPAFVYFNNDLFGHALMDAMELSGLLGTREHTHPELVALAQP